MQWLEKVRWETVCVFAVVLIGAVARSWQIGYSLGSDEIFSASLANGTFGQVIAASLRDASHPPLYNILLHVWLAVFGTSEVAARALSVAFSCGFLVFAHRLLRRYLDTWLALAMLAVFALSPFFVYYGQQVRPYSLIAFLSAANLYAFLRAVDAPGARKPLRLWALTGVALLYTQYMGALFIGGQVLYALYRLRRQGLGFVLYGAAIAAAIVPWAAAAMGRRLMQDRNPLPMIAWMVPPTPRYVVWFYASAFGTYYRIRWIALILAGPALLYIWRLVKTRSLPKEHVLLMLLAFGLPLFVFALSVWGPKPVFVPRQLAGAAVAFVVFVGVMTGAAPRPLGALFAAVLIVWCAVSVGEWLPGNKNEPWRQVAAWLDGHDRGKDVVVGDPTDVRHLHYYGKRGGIVAWDDLTAAQKTGGYLFVCRPHFCAPLRRPDMRARTALLRTWHWDRYVGETGFNRLSVYTVSPAGTAAP